jgi:hypothetical protein
MGSKIIVGINTTSKEVISMFVCFLVKNILDVFSCWYSVQDIASRKRLQAEGILQGLASNRRNRPGICSINRRLTRFVNSAPCLRIPYLPGRFDWWLVIFHQSATTFVMLGHRRRAYQLIVKPEDSRQSDWVLTGYHFAGHTKSRECIARVTHDRGPYNEMTQRDNYRH